MAVKKKKKNKNSRKKLQNLINKIYQQNHREFITANKKKSMLLNQDFKGHKQACRSLIKSR